MITQPRITVPPLWGVYTVDPSDGETGWVSVPQIPGEPTLAFNTESEAESFAKQSSKLSGFECFVGRLNSSIGVN